MLSRVQHFVTPWTVAHQAPLCMGLPSQDYWNRLPFPSPEDLPNSGIEPTSTLISQFSHSVVSDSLWPHGLQHARLPCPSPTPGAYLKSCPSSRWCHPTISSSVVPFSYCLQSFPASRSFPMTQFFTTGGRSIIGIHW